MRIFRRPRPRSKPPLRGRVTYAGFMKACKRGAKRLGIENWKPDQASLFRRWL